MRISFWRKKTFIGQACLVFGILALGIGLYLLYNTKLAAEADIVEVKTGGSLPQIDYSQTDFLLEIKKLGLRVPVVSDVDGTDKNIYFTSLERGVAHMEGTPKPDEKGNVVIFGHSNFYENQPGSYKQAFKTLNVLSPGDEILINYKDKEYSYKVEKQQLVEPEDVWVIDEPYDLTLLTCWPPGTIQKRLIIFANKEE